MKHHWNIWTKHQFSGNICLFSREHLQTDMGSSQFSKWWITMVIVFVPWGSSCGTPKPNDRNLWLVNGNDPITTYDTWDDPPSNMASLKGNQVLVSPDHKASRFYFCGFVGWRAIKRWNRARRFSASMRQGGGFKYSMFYVHPYLGKIPIWTNIFQMGWNRQRDIHLQTCSGHLQVPWLHRARVFIRIVIHIIFSVLATKG